VSNARNAVIGLLVVALVAAYSVLIFVDETEHIIITQFGEFKRTLSEPGLATKMPWQDSMRIEKRILGSDAAPEEYLTEDKKRLMADPITRWRVVDALTFYKTVGDETRARRRLDDLVLSELRQELAQRTMGDMVGNARGGMMQNVTKRVSEKAKEYGIEVVDVRIKRLDLPKEVQQSVFARMVAERERLAKKYRAQGQEESDKITSNTDKDEQIILAEARAKAEKLRGDGDAESTRMYAEAYGKDPEFYSFVRNLETYERSFDKNSTVVLSTGSKLFRYLTTPGSSDRTD
jgi:membrane protease subunit HflC